MAVVWGGEGVLMVTEKPFANSHLVDPPSFKRQLLSISCLALAYLEFAGRASTK